MDLFFLDIKRTFVHHPYFLLLGYFMPMRAFFDNIGTILLFAVVGTLFNTLCIGFSLYGLGTAGVGVIGKAVIFPVHFPIQLLGIRHIYPFILQLTVPGSLSETNDAIW